VLNIPGVKKDLEGSQIATTYWKQGDIDHIARYCEGDVVAVAQIVLRLKNLPLMNENEVVLIDTQKMA